ncbi:hypothetical protein A1O7_04873 [Cladophialophora yegresii CBS 114405]|uniref:Velvet domain-containing protein n=1 Tax=Cladophialophora yegresii CBS 114405 TaxID=1182544 RepID=W9W6U6_9EURO|nr:uncharacterized protein A1O7_04873 [Cladophialophora yegresii CBS 114405]EXJ60720.1 hypothetical protein A1O7_04873 [Cladophialophora yegresii CBS 114405]
MDSLADLQQQPVAASPPSQESGQSLPGLKETLGKEYHARRPIAPGPPPAPELFIPGQTELYLDDLPIRTYQIGENHYNMQQPPHETRSEFHRTTIDRRTITYTLEVVQQPEKARACGSGNKSSNDRRPVDPPPVVELKIFINGTEATMIYDATFMLYASLEVARPIAAGKMHTPTAIPVLAGVTVASAAYLEKPKRAAYFIFPDLSVRHEGWYRLRFSLFEGVKHDIDADMGNPFDRTLRVDSVNAPVRHEGVFNRMDVLSTPFQVYSAKKFPGLDQNTELSVLVADQGCRVRIRRDVRQRKRRPKAGADGDEAPSSYQGTPHANYQALDHSRSASRDSLGSQYDRRESVDSVHGRSAVPNRQISGLSLPMTSPLLPTPSTSMPPPSAYGQFATPRPSFDQIPRPGLPPMSSRPGQQSQSIVPGVMTRDSESKFTLPPLLQPPNSSDLKHGPLAPRYNMPAPASMKRPFRSSDYGYQPPLKSGARPDTFSSAYPAPAAPGALDIIEPDVGGGEDDDDEETQRLLKGDLVYTAADGTSKRVIERDGNFYRPQT